MCDQDKVYNPLSKRCIKTSSRTAQTLLKQHIQNKIVLKSEDVVKISAYKDTKKVSKVPKYVKERLKQYAQSFKARHGVTYGMEGHEEFCDSKASNLDHLYQPLEVKKIIQRLPIATVQNDLSDIKGLIAAEKFDFKTQWTASITYNINNYNKTLVEAISRPYEAIDGEWVKNTNSYITNLSKYEQLIILGYSHKGNIIANEFLRDNLTQSKFNKIIKHWKEYTQYPYLFPLYAPFKKLLDAGKFRDTFVAEDGEAHEILAQTPYGLYKYILRNQIPYIVWEHCIKEYCADLGKIIRQAPVIPQTIAVYRGAEPDLLFIGTRNQYYENKGFSSTSLNSYVAREFIKSENKCCLNRIVLLKGTQALLNTGLSYYPEELEVLLNHKCVFMMRNPNLVLRMYRSSKDQATSLCNDNTKLVHVTDIVVLK